MRTEVSQNLTMSTQRGIWTLLGICLFVILLSVAGLASDFLTHLLSNIDGLLLFAVCALMGGLFSLMLVLMAKEEGWLPGSRTKSAEDSQKIGEGPAAGK
jgi:hypothetical protein